MDERHDGPGGTGDEDAGAPLGRSSSPSDRFALTLAGRLDRISSTYLQRWLDHPEDVPPGLLEAIERARTRMER